MRRAAWRVLLAAALFLTLLVPPPISAAATDPGVSVAPQSGAPGTTFEVLGAGWAPNSLVTVIVRKGGITGRPVEAATDANGQFRWMLDSNGYEEGADYSVAVTPRTGVAATTPFAIASQQQEHCFTAETGFCLRGRFLAHWQGRGGLAINGYPLSAEFGEVLEDGRPYVVQYFERTRLEYHPQNDEVSQVLIGQFGRLVRPADPPTDPNSAQTWFPQTGHNVPSDFYAFWTSNGGVPQFGLPISEAFQQTLEDGKIYRVQYFERARFESHPENAAPYDLLLGQFGRLVLTRVRR